jgi:putative membrane protein
MWILTIILKVLLLSVAIFIVAQVLPKIKIKNFGTAITVAVVLSIINFLIGWLLRLLAFPLNFITFGLFNFVIFAFLLWITDLLIEDFEIKGLETTLLAAVLIAVINIILNWIVF